MFQRKRFLLIAIGLLSLSGCSFDFGPIIRGGESSANVPTSIEPVEGAIHKVEDFVFTIDEYKVANEKILLPSLGDQKLLVLPVEFLDARAENISPYHSKDEIHTMLEKAFFGSAADTAWESVASFYNKSSNGLLNLSGEVAPFYTMNMTMAEFEALNSPRVSEFRDSYDPSWTALDEAFDHYKVNNPTTYTQFDQDNDGYIDAVFVVYSAPYNMDDNSVFWAFQYYNYDNFRSPSAKTPRPYNYAFASIEFMFEGYGENQIDAHTFIHESGHLFGLEDYYTYDSDDWGAFGGLDMMDHTIGDHNGYSKMFLNWQKPYYVTGQEEVSIITLNPGELVLIKDDWNLTPFDEYLLAEFYTPTKLNKKDALEGYPANSPGNIKNFDEPGIKLYHVDSRIGSYSWSSHNFISYIDYLDLLPRSQYAEIVASNTKSNIVGPNSTFKLLRLIEPNGGSSLLRGNAVIADNSYLFRQGDVFKPSFYKSGKGFKTGPTFNDDSPLNYQIKIVEVTNNNATLIITKI